MHSQKGDFILKNILLIIWISKLAGHPVFLFANLVILPGLKYSYLLTVKTYQDRSHSSWLLWVFTQGCLSAEPTLEISISNSLSDKYNPSGKLGLRHTFTKQIHRFWSLLPTDHADEGRIFCLLEENREITLTGHLVCIKQYHVYLTNAVSVDLNWSGGWYCFREQPKNGQQFALWRHTDSQR